MPQHASAISWLEINDPLPSPESAMKSDSALSGLVAAGGGLSADRLIEAYSQGIFPWFNLDQPVLWWSPDPRMVLRVDSFNLHRSLRKSIANFLAAPGHVIKFDTAFDRVIRHCAHAKRPHQNGTWILDDMIAAYQDLHDHGFAHSVETWVNDRLVGGLYCVSIGHCVFGESMFSLQSNASKIALAALVAFAKAHGIHWIDCQQNTKHLASMGAREISRYEFLKDVEKNRVKPAVNWQYRSIYWNEIMPNRSLD
jgi:leucyl/phenylalanyl-tRNA--protein transferase